MEKTESKVDLNQVLSTKEARAEARKILNQYGFDTVDGDVEMEAALKEAEAEVQRGLLPSGGDALGDGLLAEIAYGSGWAVEGTGHRGGLDYELDDPVAIEPHLVLVCVLGHIFSPKS